jgi:hypothetical protein
MTTVIVGRHEEMDALIERRRALRQDGSDEVWEGIYHMAPHASSAHADVASQVGFHLYPGAQATGCRFLAEFSLGDGPDSYRMPDFGVLARNDGAVYQPTAVMVGEILAPDDWLVSGARDEWRLPEDVLLRNRAYAKFPYYANHQVSEIVVIDPAEHAVKAFQLTSGGKYREVERITSCNLSCLRLAFLIDWP